jgi:lysophospholipase L1-like esterase
MHKPLHSLFFSVSLFSVLSLLSFAFPSDGFQLSSSVNVRFPSLARLFTPTVKNTKAMDRISELNEIDTSFTIVDPALPIATAKKDTAKLSTGIQYSDINALKKFFESLKNVRSEEKTLRVLHYGDSQIEGDRITDYLRTKLQAQFGGEGVGLMSVMPITSSISNRITLSDGWDRYGTFTAKDKRVSHINYGVQAGFCRFASYRRIYDTTAVRSASVNIITTKFAGVNGMNYSRLRLFYGGASASTWCEFYDGPALVSADSLTRGGTFNVKEFPVVKGSNDHTLKFRGKDSPDFYGISLEGDKGVIVDNIALRGSSGTFFHQVNNAQLREFYSYLNVRFIILQFGGNSLPSIKDDEMAVNYGNYIRYQISLLKKMAPSASILFIGPSDMSIKQGTEYVTYPMLERTRDEIRKAVLETGCAFFDMYDAMGGYNSMASWVEQKLAATDYTHFSPQGARRIATLLYSALIREYNQYLSKKQ